MVVVETVSELFSPRNSDGREGKDIWYNRRISFTRFSYMFGRKMKLLDRLRFYVCTASNW